MRARWGMRLFGEPGDESNQGNSAFCRNASRSGDKHEARLIKAGGHCHAEAAPDGIENRQAVDERQHENQDAADQRSAAENCCSISPVNQNANNRRAERTHDDGDGEGTGQLCLRPTEIGFPMHQEGWKNVVKTGPYNCFGDSKQSDGFVEAHRAIGFLRLALCLQRV